MKRLVVEQPPLEFWVNGISIYCGGVVNTCDDQLQKYLELIQENKVQEKTKFLSTVFLIRKFNILLCICDG